MSDPNQPARTAEIGFKVSLDGDQMPVAIEWSATDAPEGSARRTKAIMLAVWDGDEKKAMRIDLWTKDMLVDEMKLFVFQTMMTMADTFERATAEGPMANEMRAFAHGFAEKMGFVRENE